MDREYQNEMTSILFVLGLLLQFQLAFNSQRLDVYGAKFVSLEDCREDRAMPETSVTKRTSEISYFHCARQCMEMHEACMWMNYEDNGTTNNCEVGLEPEGPQCSDLIQRKGFTFYQKEKFCLNNSTYDQVNNICKPCPKAITGQRCNIRAYDCSDYKSAYVYPDYPSRDLYIWPNISEEAFEVKCTWDKTGQIIVQRNGNADEHIDKFTMNLTWVNYTEGFGKLDKDFWLGNRRLHEVVSNNRRYRFRVLLRAVNNESYDVRVAYENLFIGNESDLFRITMTPNRGNAGKWYGDMLSTDDQDTNINGSVFSTFDRDNDGNATINCAQDYGGGWWFGKKCSKVNISGKRLSDFSSWSPSIWPQLWYGDNMTIHGGFKKALIYVFPETVDYGYVPLRI